MADIARAYAPGIAFVCGVRAHLHPGCRKHKTTLARYICMENQRCLTVVKRHAGLIKWECAARHLHAYVGGWRRWETLADTAAVLIISNPALVSKEISCEQPPKEDESSAFTGNPLLSGTPNHGGAQPS